MTEQGMIVSESQNEIEQVKMGSLLADSPRVIVEMASSIATELANIIENKHLYTVIRSKKFVNVEGWTTMAAMLGVTPKERYVKVDENGDYEAYVDLIRNSDGKIIGGASSICGSDEDAWANRPRYARRSMSVTRATGKACRLSYSWIIKLAGYEPTPLEEMPVEGEYREAPKPSSPKSTKAPQNWGELYTLANNDQLDVTLDEAKALYKKHNGDLGAAWAAIQLLENGTQPTQTTQEPVNPIEVRNPEKLKSDLERDANSIDEYDVSDKQRNLLGALLSEFFAGDDDRRHTVQLWLLGASSTKEISGAMVKAAIDWLAPEKARDGSGAYLINAVSRAELSAVYDAAIKNEGQEELPAS